MPRPRHGEEAPGIRRALAVFSDEGIHISELSPEVARYAHLYARWGILRRLRPGVYALAPGAKKRRRDLIAERARASEQRAAEIEKQKLEQRIAREEQILNRLREQLAGLQAAIPQLEARIETLRSGGTK